MRVNAPAMTETHMAAQRRQPKPSSPLALPSFPRRETFE